MSLGTALHRLNAPYYLFRPSQLWRGRRATRSADPEVEVELPWGLPLNVRSADAIGHQILANGLFDLEVSETLFRLVRPGDRALDIGANIGHMTSILALCAGTTGQVIAYEPHPGVFRELERNRNLMAGRAGLAPIELRQLALGDDEGTASLFQVDATFSDNRGSASLRTDIGGDVSHEVAVRRLDSELDRDTPIRVAKIDVEGGEMEVLKGAAAALESHQIDHIVFEEHGQYPTQVTDILEGFGYAIFRVDRHLSGPKIVDPASPIKHAELDVSLLATTNPQEVRQTMGRRGWNVLRPRSRASASPSPGL